ncbi:MAG: hypothetical protein WCI94_14965 [Rhodospirillales bacterium]|jgi:hypothetical protein
MPRTGTAIALLFGALAAVGAACAALPSPDCIGGDYDWLDLVLGNADDDAACDLCPLPD